MYKVQRLLSHSPVHKLPSCDSDEPWDRLQQTGTESEVVQMLADVQSLEKRQEQRSRFRQLCHRLEPLVRFLVTYSPAVDILVQFDVQPSALIWGSLKAILKVS